MSLLVLALNGSFKKKKRLLLHKQTTQDKKKNCLQTNYLLKV